VIDSDNYYNGFGPTSISNQIDDPSGGVYDGSSLLRRKSMAKNRLKAAARSIGSAMGKANRSAHEAMGKMDRTAHKVAKAGVVAKHELEQIQKQVESLKKQLQKTTKRLRKALA
jgi:hypothetical protein